MCKIYLTKKQNNRQTYLKWLNEYELCNAEYFAGIFKITHHTLKIHLQLIQSY